MYARTARPTPAWCSTLAGTTGCAFICATQPQGLETAPALRYGRLGYSRNASDFNTASIAIGDLAGVADRHPQGDERQRQEADSQCRRYTGVSGINVVVSPSSLTLNPGETKSFKVDFTTTTAALNTYIGGQLTWTGDGYTCPHPDRHAPGGAGRPGTGLRQLQRDLRLQRRVHGHRRAASCRRPSRPARSPMTRPTAPARSTSPNAQLIPVTIPAGTTYAALLAVRCRCQPRLGH